MLSTTDDNDDNGDADVGIMELSSSATAAAAPSNGVEDNSHKADAATCTSAQSRRLYSSPHPDGGISKSNKKKPSKLQSLITDIAKLSKNTNNNTIHRHQRNEYNFNHPKQELVTSYQQHL